MSTVLLLVVLAVAGLVVGSFLNTVIVRVPDGDPLLRPGPRCPACEAPLAWSDTVPVVSWLRLHGRCRACGDPIPVGYPLVEVANAVLWVAAGLRFGTEGELFGFLALFSVLLALSVIDLELYLLPNRITYPAIGASLIGLPVMSLLVADNPGGAVVGALIGGVGYAGFLLVVLLAYELVVHREGMGIGDVKLAALLGLWLGWLHPLLVLFALIFASGIGLVVGLGVFLVRRSSQPYPFGPWLALGAIAAILASTPILDVYGL